MAEKMYGIFHGEYSDWDIYGVTKDKKMADAFYKIHSSEGAYILELDVIDDVNVIKQSKEYKKCVVFMAIYREEYPSERLWKLSGSAPSVEYNILPKTGENTSWHEWLEYKNKHADLTVFANSKEKALKIASDYIAKKNAEELGL